MELSCLLAHGLSLLSSQTKTSLFINQERKGQVNDQGTYTSYSGVQVYIYKLIIGEKERKVGECLCFG